MVYSLCDLSLLFNSKGLVIIQRKQVTSVSTLNCSWNLDWMGDPHSLNEACLH